MGYERYDFSDEMKYNEEMWDIVQGEYDDFEYHDSFELITPEEFQQIWDKTWKLEDGSQWSTFLSKYFVERNKRNTFAQY